MATQAEVIAIGDELTSGQRLDTNSQWLSQQLGDLGVIVKYHTTVGDDLSANTEVFRRSFERADLILCTGGLGPTADDLTRQALADATQTELVLDQDSLRHIRSLFARRGREMPESNVVQAYFPAGSQVVPNPHGSAPGIDMSIPGPQPARIFAVPGVPAEMREMWFDSVLPRIEQMLGQQRRTIRHRRIKCFGVGESDLEQMLPDLIRRGRTPSVGITVSKATITLRITAEAGNEGGFDEMIAPTLETIHSCLGELVFGDEDDELQHVVIRLLQKRGQTLSVVESGPGGLLSHWLSEADERGGSFAGAVVLRGNRSVGDDPQADQSEPPSLRHERAVLEMARHGLERFTTDYCLAVGAFPETGADAEKVFFALAGPRGVLSDSAYFTGHPDILKERNAKQALNLLRLELVNS